MLSLINVLTSSSTREAEAVKVVQSPERTLWPQGQSYKLQPQGTELN